MSIHPLPTTLGRARLRSAQHRILSTDCLPRLDTGLSNVARTPGDADIPIPDPSLVALCLSSVLSSTIGFTTQQEHEPSAPPVRPACPPVF